MISKNHFSTHVTAYHRKNRRAENQQQVNIPQAALNLVFLEEAQDQRKREHTGHGEHDIAMCHQFGNDPRGAPHFRRAYESGKRGGQSGQKSCCQGNETGFLQIVPRA